MSAGVPAAVVLDNAIREQAAQNTLAANPLVGVRLEVAAYRHRSTTPNLRWARTWQLLREPWCIAARC